MLSSLVRVFILLALLQIKSSLECLQRQSDDPRHATVERLVLQAHETVEGQRSSSHDSSDPRLVKPSIVLGAQID